MNISEYELSLAIYAIELCFMQIEIYS